MPPLLPSNAFCCWRKCRIPECSLHGLERTRSNLSNDLAITKKSVSINIDIDFAVHRCIKLFLQTVVNHINSMDRVVLNFFLLSNTCLYWEPLQENMTRQGSWEVCFYVKILFVPFTKIQKPICQLTLCTYGCILSSFEETIQLISFWSKKKNSGGPSDDTLGMCCSSAVHMHLSQMSSFYFYLCCTRSSSSCH